MTRARLRFPAGDPIELMLDEVADYGPPVAGFRASLGAVFASAAGRWSSISGTLGGPGSHRGARPAVEWPANEQ